MGTDYVSILSKAVANAKGARARQAIYYRARNAVAGLRPGENLTLQQITHEATALEAAIREIEGRYAGPSPVEDAVAVREQEGQQDAEEIGRILSEPTDWKRVGIFAAVFFVVVGLGAAALWYVAGRNPRAATANAPAQSSVDLRNRIAEDLKPGMDGGSSSAELPYPLQRQVVFYRSPVVPGSIVVDREKRYLYLIESDTSARRYGIGIGPDCRKPGSLYRITDKQEWPDWQQEGGKLLPGGPGNPLGARALLFDQPERLIHGTNSPKTIGHLVAIGCIRLVNDDVEDLYRRVSVEARVIMRN